MPNLHHNNEVIGASVTVGVRIHLYGYLDRLRENAIYFDTDTIIFIQPSTEQWPIASGDNLGNTPPELLTSETSRIS